MTSESNQINRFPKRSKCAPFFASGCSVTYSVKIVSSNINNNMCMYCSSLQNLSPIGRTNFQWLPKKFKLTLAGPLFGLEIKIKLLECWTDLYKILCGMFWVWKDHFQIWVQSNELIFSISLIEPYLGTSCCFDHFQSKFCTIFFLNWTIRPSVIVC